MRYGTGCCTSFIPGQVPLWCRTRVPDRLSLHTHAGVGLGSRRFGLRRACMWRTPVCSCGRAGRREAPITRPGASGMLITGRPFRGCRFGGSIGPPACGSFFFSSRVRSHGATGRAVARPRAGAGADLSKRTRRAATVRCRHMRPGAVLTRRWPSAMPTGARILVGQVRDYSRRPRLTRAWAPARGR